MRKTDGRPQNRPGIENGEAHACVLGRLSARSGPANFRPASVRFAGHYEPTFFSSLDTQLFFIVFFESEAMSEASKGADKVRNVSFSCFFLPLSSLHPEVALHHH